MTKAILLLSVLVGLLYFLFYPFLRHKTGRKRLLRWMFLLYVIAMLISTLNTYVLK